MEKFFQKQIDSGESVIGSCFLDARSDSLVTQAMSRFRDSMNAIKEKLFKTASDMNATFIPPAVTESDQGIYI